MFGNPLPPGVDYVRILALSGRRGKPPCLWEGPATMDQATIESAIARDPRVVGWMRRNHLIQNGVAAMTLQIEAFSQGKRVDSYQVADATLLVDRPKRRQGVSDEVTLRAFDLAEHLVDTLQAQVEERDTVIGRLVERGLKVTEAPPPVPAPTETATAAPPKDSLEDLLEKASKCLVLVQNFKALRGAL